MEDIYEILHHLKNHKNSKPSEKVSVEIGELRYLVEEIRCAALNLKYDDKEVQQQAKYAVENLYKALTGLDIENGAWLIGEMDGETTKTDD